TARALPGAGLPAAQRGCARRRPACMCPGPSSASWRRAEGLTPPPAPPEAPPSLSRAPSVGGARRRTATSGVRRLALVKALVWQGPQRMEVEQRERPAPEPGAVLVRSLAAGICGSEVEGYLGRMANRKPPLVMGHEFAGEVVELGAGVDARWRGKQVAINPVVSCGECRACGAGDTNLCEKRALIGIAFPGGFAEYVNVPAAGLFELPEGTDPRVGALVEPMANGVHAVKLGLQIGPAERAA